jgi:L-fucose mutarotase/ribose pyranase (RbsD/FucU family)
MPIFIASLAIATIVKVFPGSHCSSSVVNLTGHYHVVSIIQLLRLFEIATYAQQPTRLSCAVAAPALVRRVTKHAIARHYSTPVGLA